MNSQENTGEEGEAGHRGLCQIKDSPDIINPYSEYAKGFYDGLIQEQQRIVKIIEEEMLDEIIAKKGIEGLRNWTWEEELRLLIIKIKEKTEGKNEDKKFNKF